MSPQQNDPSFDVLAIGNAIVDVLAQVDDAFLADHDLTKGAMALIDDDRAHALYADMGPAIEVSGGSAANTVAGLASLGARVSFIGKVAADQLGEVFAHDLRAAGVDYEPPSSGGELATARSFVLVTPDAQRTLNTYLGISAHLSPDDVDLDRVRAAAVLYCEGYLWDQPVAKEAIGLAMRTAADAGRSVAFTLSDSFCVDRHRREFLELLDGHVDILFANEAEICSLFETSSLDDAVEAVRGRAATVCVTRSEAGSVVLTEGEPDVAVPAASVAQVIDTTGAGDLYAAGFLFGRTRGADPATCARYGSIAAAEVISHLGARPQQSLAALIGD
ncbi:MAG: adenosine kinase [Acidimicrobiia bacterium]|nr:adenosine kinase [Acidimicrobiia bacterium]